ncbi:MAG: HD domain-containing protein, partial [Candidatus Cloacimonadota bacterium]|nr:HD domain-containing protein [Candidatus Cloacimonadota bacterium]
WEHTLDVVDKVEQNKILRISALLHDIGKSKTFSKTNTGIHFYKHEIVGLKIIDRIFRNLEINNSKKKIILSLVKNHMRAKSFGNYAEKVKLKTLAKFVYQNKDHLDLLLKLIDADNRSHKADSAINNQVEYLRKRIQNECQPVLNNEFPINGNDVIEHIEVEGKKVGKLLDYGRKCWLSDFSLDKDSLLKILHSKNKNGKVR